MFKKIGPGILVAAAFIGPGTVTVCTMAGVNFGFALLWAMLLSIVATVVLQEMAARLVPGLRSSLSSIPGSTAPISTGRRAIPVLRSKGATQSF